ncbi:MAG: hypothetical protein ACOVO2_12565 [Emticicia sp.]|uniref:hypothetical protein n=1 Tax=Emticicia sp. TaxID=1930953 RepID=UPI003BA74340
MNRTIRLIIFTIVVNLCISCKQKHTEINYPTIDYLTVKKKLDTLNVNFNHSGYNPTVTVLKHENKQIVFFGASHVRGIDHPQFKALEEAFMKQKPQIAFNEGGQVAETEHYATRDSAILKDGETGLAKFLCDKTKISLLNGDMSADEEFAGLLGKFPREQVYLYLGIERFLQPFSQGFVGEVPIDTAFQKSFIAYLDKYNFKPTTQERDLSYLYKLYFQYFKKKVDLKNLIPVHEYYLLDTGIFGKIGRTSKDIRDQALLKKIDDALDKYDRVFVVFGASHWMAVQPALKFIIEKKR